MVLLVVAQIFRILLLLNGLSNIIDSQTGEFIGEGSRSATIFGEAGDMKVPHALTLHAAQVLATVGLAAALYKLERNPTHPSRHCGGCKLHWAGGDQRLSDVQRGGTV